MKKMNFARILLVSSLLVMFGSCGTAPVPQGVLPEDKMVDLMTDVYLMEGYYADETMYHFDSMPIQIRESYDELFQKYGITQAEFDSNLMYYFHRPETYTSIQQQVLDRLNQDAPKQ